MGTLRNNRFLITLCLGVVLLFVGGCGQDSDAVATPTTGNPSSCIQVCNARRACTNAEPVDACESECEAIFAGDDVECQTKTTMANDCELRLVDVCDLAACQLQVDIATNTCARD